MYNLNDVGTTKTVEEVLKFLEENKISHPEPVLHTPLLFIWGRTNYGVVYHGTNISIIDMKAAIEALKDPNIVEYGLNVYEENTQLFLEYIVELKNIQIDQSKLFDCINKEITTVNPDLRGMLEKGKHIEHFNMPTLKCFQSGNGPISIYNRDNPHLKIKRIFNKKLDA